jgi:hypothetical protein
MTTTDVPLEFLAFITPPVDVGVNEILFVPSVWLTVIAPLLTVPIFVRLRELSITVVESTA